MMRKLFVVLGLALALSWATPAAADSIFFNPNGTGAVGAIEIDTLDQAPGNALAQDIIASPSSAFPGKEFTLNYQANLNSAQLAGSNVFEQGDSGNYFTFAAVFGEKVDAFLPSGNTATLLFSEAPGYPLNAFKMYATTADGSNLDGKGFTTGLEILSGTMTDLFEVFTFESILPSSATPLDQSNDDDYPGVETLSGIGDADIVIKIDYADQNYFPGLNTGGTLTFAITNTSVFIPFTAADPSAWFSSDAIADGDIPGVASVGAINGLSGPNTMLNADANTKFEVEQVPEPATLMLFGTGLLGTAILQRRRRQHKNS